MAERVHAVTRWGSRRDQRGTIAILVGLLALVLFGMAAIVIDLSHARDSRRQAQNGADAAALAAANKLYLTDYLNPDFAAAVTEAKNYAANNYNIPAAAWDSCTDSSKLAYVPTGSTPCISFDAAVKPTTVRVRLPYTSVGTPFAKIFNVDKVDVAALAHASVTINPASKCALCILGGGTHDTQNGNVTVSGGDIGFNGNVAVGPNGLVATNGSITVQGTASGSLANYDPDPVTGASPVSDPLAKLILPPSYIPSLSVKANPCTDGPGKYGGYNFPNSTCTLQPGLYVIAGSSGTEWKLNGNASQVLAGTGVTLYFTCGTPASPTQCAAGATGADLDASGNGQITIKAATATPTTNGAIQGLVIAYDRNNNATFRLTGNGAGNLGGTVYMQSGTLQMNGGGCSAMDSLIIVKDLTMNGNPSCLQSSYVNGDNTPLAPSDLHLTR